MQTYALPEITALAQLAALLDAIDLARWAKPCNTNLLHARENIVMTLDNAVSSLTAADAKE